MKFKKGDKAKFVPNNRTTPLKRFAPPEPYANRMVTVYGPGADDWDYTIIVSKCNNSQKFRMCNEDELEEI